MLAILLIIVLLVFVPIILGLPWTMLFKGRYSAAFAYGNGFFMELAMFHIITFPLSVLNAPFHIIVIVYSCLLVGSCAFCFEFSRKKRLFSAVFGIQSWKPFQWYEWVLLIALCLSLGIQIYRGFTYEISYMSWDDATYTVYSMDTLAVDRGGMIDPLTGVASFRTIKRLFQTFLNFPAYLTRMTGISVTVIEHTIQYIQVLLLAYLVYIHAAGILFQDRMNRLIFLVILSVFFIFGYYSHYTWTFRLLGPNYQGKAVLAVCLTPLVFSILTQKLSESYQWQTGVLLCFLSLAAISLTMWGTGTMVAIVAIPVILSLFRKERKWKHLYYVLWGCGFPVLTIAWYMLNQVLI